MRRQANLAVLPSTKDAIGSPTARNFANLFSMRRERGVVVVPFPLFGTIIFSIVSGKARPLIIIPQ